MPAKLLELLIFLPLLMLAVSAHEAAHAWVAQRLGDSTAARQGRVSLLPFTHMDLWGTLLLPVLLMLLGSPLLLGYGKPTPVDPGRLRSPKRDFALVALAGPAGNLALGLGLSLVGALVFGFFGIDSDEGRKLLQEAIVLNALLAWLNLLPLPGFDGMKALYGILPDAWCWRLQQAEPYFLVFLALLISVPGFNVALWPAQGLSQALCSLAGLGRPTL